MNTGDDVAERPDDMCMACGANPVGADLAYLCDGCVTRLDDGENDT